MCAVAAARKKAPDAAEARHDRDARNQCRIVFPDIALKTARGKERTCYRTQKAAVENKSALYMRDQSREKTVSFYIRGYLLRCNQQIEHLGADAAA